MDSREKPRKKMKNDKELRLQSYFRDELCYEYGEMFSDKEGWAYFRQLEKEVVYLKKEDAVVKIYGKIYPIPRQVAAYGDVGTTYTFSGSCMHSKPWTPLLLEMKEKVERVCGVNFNFVLVNRYENGENCINAHKDDEKDLDQHSPIASLSFGQKRTFVFSRKGYKSLKIFLENGSLLIMKHPTNQFWFHALPRENASCPRINLTFRKILIRKQ